MIELERKNLVSICEQMIELEGERRASKRRLFNLGVSIIQKYRRPTEAILEIVSIWEGGIRVKDITQIMWTEGFAKPHNWTKPRLYQVVANILHQYTKRGVIRKLGIGVYASRLNVYGEDDS